MKKDFFLCLITFIWGLNIYILFLRVYSGQFSQNQLLFCVINSLRRLKLSFYITYYILIKIVNRNRKLYRHTILKLSENCANKKTLVIYVAAKICIVAQVFPTQRHHCTRETNQNKINKWKMNTKPKSNINNIKKYFLTIFFFN
jgi:hypothetical protein